MAPVFSHGDLRLYLLSLLDEERPKVVEIVSWAAKNGDRSENGDYLYGRKRMREIDRELAHLARRMKVCRVLDPARYEDIARICEEGLFDGLDAPSVAALASPVPAPVAASSKRLVASATPALPGRVWPVCTCRCPMRSIWA